MTFDVSAPHELIQQVLNICRFYMQATGATMSSVAFVAVRQHDPSTRMSYNIHAMKRGSLLLLRQTRGSVCHKDKTLRHTSVLKLAVCSSAAVVSKSIAAGSPGDRRAPGGKAIPGKWPGAGIPCIPPPGGGNHAAPPGPIPA